MYNLTNNNYHLKPKNSNIQTPPQVSQFIFDLLRDKFDQGLRNQITDPGCGTGNLLKPWKEAGFNTYGNDIDISYLEQGLAQGACDFLKKEPAPVLPPQLILCNPPFNGMKPKLAPETRSSERTSIAVVQIWLDKIIELFGKEVPIVLFAPVGFCSNLTLESKRHEKFKHGNYPPIVSRISLPKNIFVGVEFRGERLLSKRSNLLNPFDKGLEILIFNIKGLQPHYFYQPNYE